MILKKIVSLTAFIFIVFSSINAQTITLKGAVKDSLQNPLAYANVIAKPTDVNKTLKFAITNDDGKYRLELDKKKVSQFSFKKAQLCAIKKFKI